MFDDDTVATRSAAIAAALGGTIIRSTDWSSTIQLSDIKELQIILRFRVYGKAIGRCEAGLYMSRGIPGQGHTFAHTTSFDSARDPEKIAHQIRQKLLGPEVMAKVEHMRRTWAAEDAARAEVQALVGTLTDAYPELRARMTGSNAAEFTVIKDGRCRMVFGVTAGSDTADITRGAVPLTDIARLLDFATDRVDNR
jgi:hypothetical protein